MSHIQPLTHLDTFALAASLYGRLGLFNACTLRQDTPGSPHRDTRSIFLRGPDEPTVARWFEDVPHKDYPVLAEWPEAQAMIERIAAEASAHFGLGKVMLIELKPGGALTWHRDEGPYAEATERFHVALVTNPKAFLYSGGEHVHLPVGVLARFDTTVLHSAVNHGPTPRVHLVVDVRRG